ncbi:MAG: ATP-binding protein [Actinomycetota bacterium]
MNESSSGVAGQSLPEGTVTFLFTDIQGSTKLLRRLGDSYGAVLGAHRTLLRAAFARNAGREVDTQGDAFFVAFSDAWGAVNAAVESQLALLEHPWAHGEPVLVRMGIHTGDPLLIEGHYVGIDVHRAARICSSAHGGQIVLSEASLQAIGKPPVVAIRFADLGRHRLKDLEQPEHLYQVIEDGIPSEFPALRSLKPPTNVPRHVGGLVGRSQEKQDLERMLRVDGARAVTVTGPGGTGKTRLAAAAALDLLDHFSDGVYFVDLSAANDAALVSSAIGQVVGVQGEGEEPLVDAIVNALHDRRMLLLLDNFEQALDGAVVVSDLLHRAPHLSVLVTSRIVLSIEGERELSLAPLVLPHDRSRSAVEESEAAELFIERARQARPGFVLTDENAGAVADACILLDGLPLALELAAARIKLFSPAALVHRLNDRLALLTGGAGDKPDRHRTLRSTIDWSYHLLTEGERAFFRDLAVFNGGATFEAAEAVAGEGQDPLDALTTLVGHSLLRQREDADGEVRFSMLQTIRDYASEMLSKDPGRAALSERHARYYLELAESIAGEANSRPTELDRLDGEHDNMRTALEWWLEREAHPVAGTRALRLTVALGHYWYTHGYAVEGGRWLERALAVGGERAPARDRARALRLLGIMMEQQRHLERARSLFGEALELFRKIGDRGGEASSLNSLGVLTRSLHDLDAAEKLFEESVALRRDIGDEPGTASSLSNLALVAIDRGDFDRAWDLLENTLRLDRARGDEWGVAVSIANRGVIQLERGDLDDATTAAGDALRRFVDMGEADCMAEALETFAGIAAAQERFVRAARIAGGAGSLRRSAGIPLARIDLERLDRWLGPARAGLGEEAFESARREGAEMTTDQAVKYALPATPQPLDERK